MRSKSYLFIIGIVTILGLLLTGCGSETKESKAESADTAKKETQSQTAESEVTDAKTFYFTANEGGTISKVSAADNSVEATIETNGVVHNVQVSPDGKILGATLVPLSEEGHGEGHGDSHGEDSNSGNALFYDTETNELLQTVKVGGHPAHIVFTKDGKYALVTNNEDQTVSVIEMETFTVVNTIATGKGPHGFRISDDHLAYIANMGEDTVSVVNLETMKEEQKIKVGATPVTTGITTDGKTLVVTLHSEDALAIVNLETNEVTKVEVGDGPAQVYLDSTNQFAYVANQGTEDAPSHSMTIIDLTTKTATATIETGKGAHGVVTSNDNKFAYVTNMFENTVTVIDLVEKKAIKTIEVGEVPNGISIMN